MDKKIGKDEDTMRAQKKHQDDTKRKETMKRDHGADNEKNDTMDKKIREDEDTMRAQKTPG